MQLQRDEANVSAIVNNVEYMSRILLSFADVDVKNDDPANFELAIVSTGK